MNINKRPWPLATICGPIKNRIDTRPDYQRPLVWSKSQKQLLIDTLLRGYDVPKLYWRQVGKNPDRYEVVDGQQRLHAIWDFHEGNYSLPSDADPINGYKVADLHYSELQDELRIHFDTYPLDIVILEGTEEDEAREMFLRLQSGTTLRAAEKRNAMSSNLRDLVCQLAKHEFLTRCGFANRRFDYDQVIAQMTLLELSQGPCEVKDPRITQTYEEYADFDFGRGDGKKIADKIRRVLGFLGRAFLEKTPEIKKTTAVSLYWLVSTLMETHAISGLESSFGNWFIEFEIRRLEDEEKPQDERDPDMVTYHDHIVQATNSQESIDYRHRVLSSIFMLAFPNLPRLDNQREFTFEQRLAIFRKHDGICQWVDSEGSQCGIKCSWSDWHADHIIPWSKGGTTTVTNGQVLCPKHNLIKGSEFPITTSASHSLSIPRSIEKVSPSEQKTISTKAPNGRSKYNSTLTRLREIGWQPEQLLGEGRNSYTLDANRRVIAMFYYSAKQRRGNYDFYFFALTCSLFERLRSRGELYVFLECGTHSTVLVLDFCTLKIEYASTRSSEFVGVIAARRQHAITPTSDRVRK